MQNILKVHYTINGEEELMITKPNTLRITYLAACNIECTH